MLPTSWATPQIEYLAQARKLADSGYVVLTYNSRGFWQSGGHIEVAGPADVADASAVLDWALAHTPADPERIGMAGVSYGAGISLMAAAHDPRIKAVAALSGWADLIDSIYSGRTQHLQAAALLGGTGYLTGRPGPELRQVLHDFLSSDLSREQEMIDWGRKRSPATYLDRLNTHRPAILMGNAWGDTVFPPNQYASFYEKLAGPKRLELRPGDHATAEAGGLLGLPNDVWTSTRRWFDHHLKGADNGIDREQPVRLKSRSGGPYEGYSPTGGRSASAGTGSPSAASSASTRTPTRAPTAAPRCCRTPSTSSSAYRPRCRCRCSPAPVPPCGGRAVPHHPAGARHRDPPHDRHQRRQHAAHLRGVPLRRRPPRFRQAGEQRTHTFHGRTPGEPFTVDLELFSTAYDVPAGHRLALVLDGVDPLYIDHNPTGARLTFSRRPPTLVRVGAAARAVILGLGRAGFEVSAHYARRRDAPQLDTHGAGIALFAKSCGRG